MPSPFVRFDVHVEDRQAPTPLKLHNDSLASVFTELQGVVTSHNALREKELIADLTCVRTIFKQELLFRDTIILRVSVLIPISSPLL